MQYTYNKAQTLVSQVSVRPSDIYKSESDIQGILHRGKYIILDFRPPKLNEIFISRMYDIGPPVFAATVNDVEALGNTNPRFIVVTVPPPPFWE